jgi:hypothetical protein
MAISIAFFGLGIGALTIHILKNKRKTEYEEQKLPSKILKSSIAFAVSLPIFLFLIGHIIPPSLSFISLFFLVSSVPFFLGGMSMALVYLAMPREVSKLYFIDLAGAAAATLILDPLLQGFGAESLMILIGILVIGPTVVIATILRHQKKDLSEHPRGSSSSVVIGRKLVVYGIILLCVSGALLAANLSSNILAISPGKNKGLTSYLADPSHNKHLSSQWNSFSRIDVIGHNTIGTKSSSNNTQKSLGSILIDADALTPILRWNGSTTDIQWLKRFMDYLPYELAKTNNNDSGNTLVIGSGGGEDILVALAGGSKNVTAVELNPLIVSAAKRFGGSSAGNLYQRNDVHLFVDDGRRFISSTNSKFDKIVIKLVDSWAAQLAGGYALSENYLYTVEAFKQYLRHLDGNNGMLVMVRWSTELPRLMPLVVESLRQEETEKSIQEIAKQIMVVEDRPGLTFGSDDQRIHYPVLVMVKNSPFTGSELDLAKERIAKNDAKVIAMPGGLVQPPYDRLLLSSKSNGNGYSQQQQQLSQVSSDPPAKITSSFGLKPPTDDSPFYFANEQIPKQLVILIVTVLGVSAVLAVLLVYYSKLNRIKLTTSSRFHIAFVILIGLGFIFLEITFIQKFLLLLGTPIMALTVILFSILLSSGIGAYLSGRLFSKNPYKAVVISIPLLAGILLAYYGFLQQIIDANIVLPLYYRIGLTFALLSPAGLLMGFQFPSITRMASSTSLYFVKEGYSGSQDITLLWGINIIASVIGTVLTTTSSMVIGFNGNLLIGFGLYLGALGSAIATSKITQRVDEINI